MSMVFTKILDFLCLMKASSKSQAFSFAFVNYLPKQNENYRNTYKLCFDDHRVLVWNVLLYQGEPVTPLPPLPSALSLQRKNWAVTDRKGNGPRIVRSQTFSFTHSYWGTWWKSSHFRILSYDHLVLFGIQYIPTDSLIDEYLWMWMMREYLWWVSEEEIDVLSI